MNADTVRVVPANLDSPAHCRAVVELTAAYARDEMGNGAPLAPEVESALIAGLRRHPTTAIFLAYVDAAGDAVGIATCFVGFSTFAARPVINIHDLAVLPPWRGRGVGRALLAAVEMRAYELGCAKVTMEVGERNVVARRAYEAAGFQHADCGPAAGAALFYVKPIAYSSS